MNKRQNLLASIRLHLFPKAKFWVATSTDGKKWTYKKTWKGEVPSKEECLSLAREWTKTIKLKR